MFATDIILELDEIRYLLFTMLSSIVAALSAPTDSAEEPILVTASRSIGHEIFVASQVVSHVSSIVVDTYDIKACVRETGSVLKLVEKREGVIIRRS
jgi:hypothetical protein